MPSEQQRVKGYHGEGNRMQSRQEHQRPGRFSVDELRGRALSQEQFHRLCAFAVQVAHDGGPAADIMLDARSPRRSTYTTVPPIRRTHMATGTPVMIIDEPRRPRKTEANQFATGERQANRGRMPTSDQTDSIGGTTQ